MVGNDRYVYTHKYTRGSDTHADVWLFISVLGLVLSNTTGKFKLDSVKMGFIVTTLK